MGAKRLWRHILGSAIAPVLYAMSNGIPMLADRKTPATEDQIENKESKMVEFEKQKYLAHHIILSTTSACLGSKIKGLRTAEEMWKKVREDVTSKSTLHLLDAEDQLASMKLANNNDPKTHLSELKAHFQMMIQQRDNLLKIGSTLSDSRFNIIIMSSLPESYWSTLQTITASKHMSKLSGSQSHSIKADNLIAFIIEEAQHRVINDDHTKTAKSALAACTKKTGKSKGKRKDKNQSDATCGNCKKTGHTQANCYAKGGGKEGQAPWMKNNPKKPEAAVVAADDEEGTLFAFTCTSDYEVVADKLDIPKSKLGTCIDSGVSRDYCLDHAKFTNYRMVQ